MRHKLISSILALLFLVLISSFRDVFRFLLAASVIYSAIFLAYNYWYLKSKSFYTFWSWLRPFFFLCTLLGLFLVVPSATLSSGLYLIIATLFLFIVELYLINASEQKVFFETLFSYFGLALTIFAFNFYFVPSNSLTLVLLFFTSYLVTRASLDYVPVPNPTKNFYAWLLALIMLEVAWSLIYLPLTFVTLSVIIFNIFYGFWIVIYHQLYHNLSLKKIVFHLVFALFIIIIAFLSTPWRIV
jgi:hypothetical protein